MSERPDAGSALHLRHETWGDHEALLARTRSGSGGRVGVVETQRRPIADAGQPFHFEHGGQLDTVEVAYQTYGELDARGRNAILICHALTGSAHAAGVHNEGDVPGWWDPLIGPGKPIDTNRYFVLSTNVLGGCYGSTGPGSLNPKTNQPYGPDFPRFTIRDMVNAQKRLAESLGITSFASVVGGSMGGMQVLEWAAAYPEWVRSMVPIATTPRHSAWAIGLNDVARRAIVSDAAWKDGRYGPDAQPETGLGLARAIAMLSYRSFDSLESKFGRERVVQPRADWGDAPKPGVLGSMLSVAFEIQSYLAYQGVQLTKRFDANTYLYLTRAMDDFDLADGRGRLRDVLASMAMPALVIGIDSDVLYPESESKTLAESLPNSTYHVLRSPHGHDAFLIEFPQIAARLRRFLNDLES